jgi:hypothetical protein
MLTFAVILLCVNVVLWIFLYLRLDNRFNAATMLESVRDEVTRITLEINKTTDRLLTLMDSRKTELRELLAQAERQMTLVNESLDRLDQVEGARFMFQGNPTDSSSTKPAVAKVTIAEPPAVSAAEAAEPISLRQRARSLAATGLSSEAIADTLGLSVTEVELFTL